METDVCIRGIDLKNGFMKDNTMKTVKTMKNDCFKKSNIFKSISNVSSLNHTSYLTQ